MKRITKRWLMTAIGFMTAGMMWAWAQESESTFTLSVQVELVSVEALVLDANGRPALDLTAEDFIVHDNGDPQRISHFFPAAMPYHMLLLIQNSGTFDQRSYLATGVNAFIAAIRSGDRIAVGAFDHRSYWSVLDWRPQPPERPQNVVLTPSGSALQGRLYHAVGQSIDEFERIDGRKGVIVLTDGHDRAMYDEAIRGRMTEVSRDADFQRLLSLLRDRSIPFYFLVVDGESGAVPPRDWSDSRWGAYLPASRSRLEALADASGGAVIDIRQGERLDQRVGQVVRELGSSYGLAYSRSTPSGVGEPRRIEVRVRQDGLRVVQSRYSYTPR